jgi:hypothetical protein
MRRHSVLDLEPLFRRSRASQPPQQARQPKYQFVFDDGFSVIAGGHRLPEGAVITVILMAMLSFKSGKNPNCHAVRESLNN